jgi:drug/metabolite transporter (DMT)-like permease
VTGPGRYAALAVTFSFLWAAAFIAVKVALRDSPPVFLMAFRFLVAGALLLAVARLGGRPFPAPARTWRALAVLGLLNHAIYLGLASVALRHVSAGTGAVLASTNPLLTAVAAAGLLRERLSPARAGGLLLSFAGVVWVMRSRVAGGDEPWAVALMLGAIGVLVAGTIRFKRLPGGLDLVVVNGVQLAVAGLCLLPVSAALEPLGEVRFTPAFLGAQAFLVLGVSCLGMGIWLHLLRHGDATRASAYFFLNPVFGLLLGAVLLGEPLGPADLAGSAAVGLGIYVVQRAPAGGAARPAPAVSRRSGPGRGRPAPGLGPGSGSAGAPGGGEPSP